MRASQLLLIMAVVVSTCNLCGAETMKLNVRDYGAVGDGKQDDTSAFQRALNEAVTSGPTVFAPAGRYLIAGTLTVPPGVTLEGTWTAPHHDDVSFGSALFATAGRDDAESTPLLTLNPSSCVRGFTIFYPGQDSANIHPYPWSIRIRGMHCSVENVTLTNSYLGIDAGSEWNELHYIRNVFGCVLKTGVYVDKCSDIGRIENVHFNPHYWFRLQVPEGSPKPDANAVIKFMNENLEAFVFGRTDWEYVFNTFAFGFKTGYKFIKTKDGAANGNFLGIGADAGQICLLFEASQPMGIQITNGEFTAMAGENPTQVMTAPGFDGVAQLTNCAFWGDSRHLAVCKGPGHLNLNQCNFINCGKGGSEEAAIVQDNGSLQVSACRFSVQKHNYFSFGKNAKSAIITGNWFAEPLAYVNTSRAQLVIENNVAPVAKPKTKVKIKPSIKR